MEKDLAKILEDLEQGLPEEMRTVVTDHTIAAEAEFLRQMRVNSFAQGGPVLTRMHVSWGPNAKNMTQEQLVEYLWKIQRASGLEHDVQDIDQMPRLKKEPIDLREFVQNL